MGQLDESVDGETLGHGGEVLADLRGSGVELAPGRVWRKRVLVGMCCETSVGVLSSNIGVLTYTEYHMRTRDIYIYGPIISTSVWEGGQCVWYLFSYQVPPTPAFFSYIQSSTLRNLSGIRTPQ